LANVLSVLKYPLHYSAQIQSLKFSIDLNVTKFQRPLLIHQIDLTQYGENGSITLDLICKYRAGESPDNVQPDRKLAFSSVGRFVFDEARVLLFHPPFGSQSLADPPFERCEHYDSGYRSTAGAPALRFGPPAKDGLLRQSANEYFIAVPSGTGGNVGQIGAYSDSQFVLYFVLFGASFVASSDDRYRVIPEGQAWIWSALRKVSGKHWEPPRLRIYAWPIRLPSLS
jgi:hypothetical protein